MPLSQFGSLLGDTINSVRDAAETRLTNARDLALHRHAPVAGRPEIIFLPGLPGSVLEETADGDLVWFNFSRAISGTLGTDLNPSGGAPPLTASDMFPGLYDLADLAWRGAGFRVHRFPFDWRLPVRQAAQGLRTLVTQRKSERPGVAFLPVAHSHGGLVVCEYARQFPDFDTDFGRAVFLGTPFGGTYTAVDALLGSAGFIQNIKGLLDAVGGNGTAFVDDARRATCNMQGLAELLPDPAKFQHAAGLYDANQYEPGFRPAQSLLDAGRSFKAGLLNPTLLGRATVIMSDTFPTAADDQLNGGVRTPGVPQRGDGTTTLGSGLPSGILDAFQARLQHLWLPLDSEVIQCVTEIGILGNVNRSLHTPLTPEPGPLAAPLFTPPPVDALKEVAVRFLRHRQRTSDLLWLFSK